jgi:hypothetical protein
VRLENLGVGIRFLAGGSTEDCVSRHAWTLPLALRIPGLWCPKCAVLRSRQREGGAGQATEDLSVHHPFL